MKRVVFASLGAAALLWAAGCLGPAYAIYELTKPEAVDKTTAPIAVIIDPVRLVTSPGLIQYSLYDADGDACTVTVECSVEGGAWLVPQFLSDGKRSRGVVWNASPDERYGFTVMPPKGFPQLTWAVQIDAHGTRYRARVEGNRVTLPRALNQWECVVFG